ncbi:MAG: acetate kinase [Coriobacteriia bacterium]|nr:acetate kinase [Coriobacteriia bacterium]
MKILVINCGSSSLKYQLIEMDTESVLAKGLCERIGIDGSVLTHTKTGCDKVVIEEPMPSHKEAVQLVFDALLDSNHGVISSMDEVYAIGHRTVHGGNVFTDSVIVGEKEKEMLKEVSDLAPLHNPANLLGIEACEKVAPGKKNVAVWDTAFGMGMDPKSYLYAIPYELYLKYGIRKYGFHGTSHKYVSGEIIKLANLPEKEVKVIVCHLGNGASVSCSIGGKCVDTSMGLTPLDGLIMGTRSGTIDPGAVQYMCQKLNIGIDECVDILNKESGILGLSGGVSSDFRDVGEAAKDGNEYAKVALEAYRYRVAGYIGQYVAYMNGVDAIAFTAGVGENDIEARAGICSYLTYLGVEIDDNANNVRGEVAQISTDNSKVKVYVYPTNEELAIARETLRLVK